MNIDFVLDSVYVSLLPRLKDEHTVKILMDAMKNAKESLGLIDLIDEYKDLERCSSGYLFSADPIYCSSYVNQEDDGIRTSVITYSNDVYVYMYKIVGNYFVYTKSPYICIGFIDPVDYKFFKSSTLDEDMKSMKLSRTFKYYINNIVFEYENDKRYNE